MLPSKSLSKPFRPPFKIPSSVGPASTTATPATTGTKGVTNITNNTLKPKIETKVAPEKVDENNKQNTDFVNTYFEIYYTKDVKKKNKSFSDGFIELTRHKIKMFDADGNDVYNTARGRFFKDTPKPDEEYSLGPYLIQIQKQIPSESFTSGRCFLKHQSNPAAHIKPVLQTSSLLHKKMKVSKDTEAPVEIKIPTGAYPLVEGKPENNTVSCYIDPFLCTQMRIHQKEGVKFMFECITGLKAPEITGCILADSMGLGKTLQTIGLIWTLIKQNPHSAKKPFVNKAIVLAPLSVVKNWEKEIAKWLGSARLQPLLALGDKDDVSKTIENFKSGHYRCLLTSYEVFMKYATTLNGSCDLLILDEGHRLKNLNNKTFQCFSAFSCKRRIILTGTPLQNRLEELYACCEFINPGIFPNLATFRKVFINPITAGLKKNASTDDHSLAADRSKELSKILASFILRRSASILESILPPKHEYFLLLRLTEAQKAAYKKILNMKVFRSEITNEGIDAFSLIIVLRKLLNHPKLFVQDKSDSAQIGLSSFPENIFQMNLWESSIKFKFTKQLIDNMQHGDKMVIVSYFTQTLELIETMCNEINIKYLRLDGQVQGLKRQRLVDRFNDKTSGIKLFLLCAKAGGTGLNLTGANKMVLFEADWNPSNDHQIMGRIWRDGQKKEAKIYRLVSCGTIEEKIVQRQFVKENLSLNVVDEKNSKSLFDTQDLKKIFKFENDTKSIIFEEKENEKDKAFEENDDLTLAMKNDIVFVKKKTDTSKAKAQDEAVKNEMEEDQFFLNEEEEEEKKESDESGEAEAEGESQEKKEESDDGECIYTFSEDEEEEEKEAKSQEKKVVKKEEKIESSKEEEEEENSGSEEEGEEEEEEDEEEEDSKNVSQEEQELEKNMGSMTIEKTTPPSNENSNTIEVEPVKEEKAVPRSGKESLKRKEPTNNIGENVLKKLKLL